MSIGGVPINPGDVGVVSILLLLFVLLTTDSLVTGKRLRRAEARADRLEERIWALMDAASVAITAAEVSNEAIRRIPVVEDDDDVSAGVS